MGILPPAEHHCTMPGTNNGLCNTILRTIWITSTKGRPIRATMCPICDHPRCTACKRIAPHFWDRVCEHCGAAI